MPKLPYLSPPNKNFRHLECNRAGAASGAGYQDRPSEKSLIYGRRDFFAGDVYLAGAVCVAFNILNEVSLTL
jgi:hypothetical protein